MAEYPLPKFHFQVEWGGTKIGFTEVTGLEVTTEKIEYRDGASKEYHKVRMPGMQTFGDLTLKRVVWKVKNAWPTKVTSTDLNASGNETAIETLVVTHEGLTMENG